MAFDSSILKYASPEYNNYISGGRMSRKYRADTIDMAGRTFFQLTAIEKVVLGKYQGAKWRCMCTCGNTCIVYGGHLRAGKRKSCGCISESRIDETGIKNIISFYKRKCKQKSREFSLSFDEFSALIKSNCSYCGNAPNQILKRQKSKKIQIIYNGIDRKDPSIGYVLSNCVAACRYCNQAKSDLSIGQFKEHIERIYKWLSIGS